MIDRIFKAAHADVGEYVARGAYREDVAQAAVEQDFGGDARVGTGDDCGERVLAMRGEILDEVLRRCGGDCA